MGGRSMSQVLLAVRGFLKRFFVRLQVLSNQHQTYTDGPVREVCWVSAATMLIHKSVEKCKLNGLFWDNSFSGNGL